MDIMSKTSLNQQINEVELLLNVIKDKETLFEKVAFLSSLSSVKDFLIKNPLIKDYALELPISCDYVVKSIIAINQGPIVFNLKNTGENRIDLLKKLTLELLEIEKSYKYIGGIIGYHLNALSLINNQKIEYSPQKTYIHPECFRLDESLPELPQILRWGLESFEKIFEMYPIGGAGDRLNLKDSHTGFPLPAALLPFLGKTLLEGLIRDLEGREYLYFKLFHQQIWIPVALMTSTEKNNHSHILSICQNTNWFGRRSDNFSFFIQPAAPVITEEGEWSLFAPLCLSLKPGGHGVIWGLAQEEGIFNHLEKQGRRQCIIRQINNPIGGTDSTILALIGLGCHSSKDFGFVSCERPLNCEEGMNVVVENKVEAGYEYSLQNIEYTNFKQCGIEDVPANPGSLFSIFPTNTNILFANIPSIQKALELFPLPGQLINMKSKVPYIDSEGQHSQVRGGRLESTMQSIADQFIKKSAKKLSKEELKNDLNSFIVYNKRPKTISTTKKSYLKGVSSLSTPEQAFYDLLMNHYHLLIECGFKLPEWREFNQFLLQGPACLFLFHPALGPLYSVIKQKIRNGYLHLESEIQLEIAEISIENLELKGSLLVEANPPVGVHNSEGYIEYNKESRCFLKNVIILNQGIDRTSCSESWRNKPNRLESVKIILHEGAEFSAEGILLEGSHFFEVPPNHKMTLLGSGCEWKAELVPIESKTWEWRYEFDSDDTIKLSMWNEYR